MQRCERAGMRTAQLLGGLAILLQACGTECLAADVQRETSSRAGSGAIDCGDIAIGGDATAAATCATNALQAGTPFRATVQAQGVDSEVIVGWALNAEGQLFQLNFDSDRTGGSMDGGAIFVSRCVGATPAGSNPELLRQGQLFTCASTGAATQICGE